MGEDRRAPAGRELTAPVVVLGDALVDFVCQVDELPPRGGDAVVRTFQRRPGGAGSNVATGLAALGIPCSLVTAVGDDEPGRDLLHHLVAAGVDVSLVACAGATGQVLSFADARGERTMFSYRGAATAPVVLSPDLAAALAAAPLIFGSGYGLQDAVQAEGYLACFAEVRAAGGQVAFDPSPGVGRLQPPLLERALALTDLLLPNEAELAALTGAPASDEAVATIMTRVDLLGLKLGPRGSLVAVRDGHGLRTFLCSAKAVAGAETTGAGDAFDAGFLAALLRGEEPQRWGEAGNAAALARLTAGGSTFSS